MSLARVGIRGAYFTSIALGFRQLVSLCTTFYVARQILPADIGLFSIVMIVIGLAQVIGDLGIATGLVRSQKNSSDLLSTCFWISASIGTVLSTFVYFLAPVAGWFYNKPEIQPFLQASAAGLVVNFLTPVPMALLQQKLAYKEISMVQGLSSLVGAVAAIALVYSGFGIWGLVLQPIIGNISTFAGLSFFSKWLPKFEFNMKPAKEIIYSGFHLLGAGITGYFRNSFDAIVIGKSLPAADLGLYGMAQTILYAPMHLITSTISRVIFPLLAKVQGDQQKIIEAVLTATSRTALIILPLYFGLFVLAEDFVIHIFGAQWVSMVPLIRVMSISFIVQSIGNVSNPIMLALGKTKMVFGISISGALVYFSVLLILIPRGLSAVAIGYASINTLIALTSLLIALGYVKIKISTYLKAIYKPLLYSILMSLVIIIFRNIIQSNELLEFITLIFIGFFLYSLLIFVFEKNALIQTIKAIID
jgi:O-antigen/teichoic acid export membrane protein